MFSKKIRELVYNKFDGHCAYCGCKIELKDMQIDHIKSKRNGGSDDIENLYPSCRACNFYKDTCSIEEFRGDFRLKGLIERLRKTFIFRLAEKYGMVETKEWDKKFYFEK